MRRIATIPALLLAAALAPAALALEGYIQDTDAQPLEGARVCYVLPGGAAGLCAVSDARGYYSLPDSDVPRVRVVAQGHLVLERSATPHDKPLRLERAASLLVRLRDAATGEPIEEGRVRFVTSTGKRRGPFPANAAGVRVSTLPPGRVKVSASAEGYGERKGQPVDLVAGEEAVLELELQPRPKSERADRDA